MSNKAKLIEDGSLFSFINKCKTPFGTRLLKRWLLAPLISIEKICERLDAVEDLIKFPKEIEEFKSKLVRIGDLEKRLSKIYTYSIRHSVKAIYFENISFTKLKEFKSLLKTFKDLVKIL